MRGRAIGTWAGFAALTTAAGALLGVRRPRPARSTGRAARAVLTFAALTFGFTAAGERSLAAPAALGGVALGVVLLLAFLLREAPARAPMLPLGLLRSPRFSGANLLTLLLDFAPSGVLVLVPFNLIQVHGYSALGVGAAFLRSPGHGPDVALGRRAGRALWRQVALDLGPADHGRRLCRACAARHLGSYWTTFFPAMLVLGIGMTISVAPLTTTVMNAVDERHRATASGINNAASRIAGLLAVALLGALAFGLFEPALAERLAGLDLPAATRAIILEQSRAAASLELPATLDGATAGGVRAAVKQSFVEGLRTVMLATAAAAAASAMVAAAMIRGRPATAAS